MKYILSVIAVLLLTAPLWASLRQPEPGQAVITGSFWKTRRDINRQSSIPHQYNKLRETGRLEAICGSWHGKTQLTQEEREECIRNGAPHFFWDSDTAKWIEAAAYTLAEVPDEELKQQLEDISRGIEGLQQPDGYINSYFTLVEPQKRFASLYSDHELYCAGHLIEAGIALYKATGSRRLLSAVTGYARLLCRVFGENGNRSYDGHPEIELALIRLYRLTSDESFLTLAKHFIDVRGTLPHPWDTETGMNHSKLPIPEYMFGQAHKPVREQTKAEGHAVRAMYLYCAMTDIASITGDKKLSATMKKFWRDVTRGKQYITGGIGSDPDTEGFAGSWELSVKKAYCESCANIAFVMWAQRLHLSDPKSEYHDGIEKVLYNVFPASAGSDGKSYSYTNPLASNGWHHRSDWFGCACCPPNIARLIASLDTYIYSYDEKVFI